MRTNLIDVRPPRCYLYQLCSGYKRRRAERPANRARNAKKEPMARCPLASLVRARDFVSYDTLSRVQSIFLWQHEDCCRAIRFRQDPYFVTGAGGIRGQNPKPLLDG